MCREILLKGPLCNDKWTLIGNSYGSHYALNYAIVYPEHTSKVILTASPGTNNQFLVYYSDNINMRYSEKDIEILNKLRQSGKQGSIERMQISFKPYFYDQSKVVELFDPPKEEIPFFYNFAYFKAAIANPTFLNWDISKEVYETDIPIHIIQGRQDPVNGTEVQLNERAKNSELTYIERAGHFPWVEQPEAFFSTLRKSLTDS
ncbi:MAG TPA: alpha/beta hydrolase [Fodinibius sp.]|nr:alpha/beta hydrolase [Fodinibius sp.]